VPGFFYLSSCLEVENGTLGKDSRRYS